MKVNIPQNPWYGDDLLELDFPSSWEVEVCRMAGENAPKLSGEAIQAAFDNPIGTGRIRDLARGKKEVVIIFDDLSRPTKTAELIPYVLRELKEAGIENDNIRFIAALGAHGQMKLNDFQKKLGRDIPRNFRVYNHNPYENCTLLGKTSRGTPVAINSEVMSCDFKIAIGAVVPHPLTGFGGGAKIILPGIAYIDSIYANHHNLSPGKYVVDGVKPLDVDNNPLRLDSEEAAGMVGLDVMVNVVVNLQRDTVGLYVGDVVTAHREAVKLGESIYTTKKPVQPDVYIINNYGKASEASVGLGIAGRTIPPEGGDVVLIGNIPEGQCCHYLLRSYGKTIGGKLWHPIKKMGSRIKRLIVLGPDIDMAGLDLLGPDDKTVIADSWPEIIKILQATYGQKCKVAVIPDASIQYFPGC
ncbi:MAG: DUF2088 domain-containing protein [Dehalococcoidales bacterium]|nr:DUF2088 domain-containing protein [Dehalococcoidales bacterium]